MINGVKYDKIDENGHLHVTGKDGKTKVLEVDNVIMCAGQVPHRDLEEASKDSKLLASKVYTIGGAFEAGELDAKRAIDMGTRLALVIHDPTVVPGKHKFGSRPGPEEKLFQLVKKYAM
jgi:2,4-dienoyl-CoA reductase (NADPH2)